MSNYSIKQRNISYVLKAVVFIAAVLGTFLSAFARLNSFMGGYRVFMFFTIQSNIAVAVLSAVGAYYMLHDRAGDKLFINQ